MSKGPQDRWDDGSTYERYCGRWSREVATDFLDWLSVPAASSWVDVGCGTGRLSETILAQCAPRAVVGIERSAAFLSEAKRNIVDARVRFELGDATNLPVDTATHDATVAGLVLNFVTDHEAMLREMARVTKTGGKVAVYVWDYAGRMEVIRQFWDAVAVVTPGDAELDEGNRFPICRPEPIKELFQVAGLTDVSARAIDIAAVFRDFSDYWTPFLGGGIGPAPTYLASVDAETKERIRQILLDRLVFEDDGTIVLTARAWAVQGTVMGS